MGLEHILAEFKHLSKNIQFSLTLRPCANRSQTKEKYDTSRGACCAENVCYLCFTYFFLLDFMSLNHFCDIQSMFQSAGWILMFHLPNKLWTKYCKSGNFIFQYMYLYHFDLFMVLHAVLWFWEQRTVQRILHPNSTTNKKKNHLFNNICSKDTDK